MYLQNVTKYYKNFVKVITYKTDLSYSPKIPFETFGLDNLDTSCDKFLDKISCNIDVSSEIEFCPVARPDIPPSRSIRRSKVRLADYILMNDFEVFATFTFDPMLKDRYNINKCKSTLSNWLKVQKKLYKDFKYIVIPELHKDGAIHFHGLLKNYNGILVNSGKSSKGKKIYNIKSYRSGFTTATKIEDYEKLSSYVTKYIIKDMTSYCGKKRYFCSKGLKLPSIVINDDIKQNPFLNFNMKYENDFYIIETCDNIKELLIKEF